LGTPLLCTIYDATVENTLFKDGEGVNILCAFNPTQAFLHLKNNLLLIRYRAPTNMLIIILLCSGYFLKIYILKNILR